MIDSPIAEYLYETPSPAVTWTASTRCQHENRQRILTKPAGRVLWTRVIFPKLINWILPKDRPPCLEFDKPGGSTSEVWSIAVWFTTKMKGGL